ISADDLGSVPASKLTQLPPAGTDRCERKPAATVPPRYRPALNQTPLTFAVPFTEVKLFGSDFKPAYETDLNNHKLPADLQSVFDAQSIGFLTSLSVQGATPEWSVSDGKS